MKRFIAKSAGRWVLACSKEYTPTPASDRVILVQEPDESFYDFELRASRYGKGE